MPFYALERVFRVLAVGAQHPLVSALRAPRRDELHVRAALRLLPPPVVASPNVKTTSVNRKRVVEQYEKRFKQNSGRSHGRGNVPSLFGGTGTMGTDDRITITHLFFLKRSSNHLSCE